jgi:hypothetical protein
MPTAEHREHYARRANEARKMAEAATDPNIRASLEGMASSYDRLVEEVDRITQIRSQLPLS